MSKLAGSAHAGEQSELDHAFAVRRNRHRSLLKRGVASWRSKQRGGAALALLSIRCDDGECEPFSGSNGFTYVQGIHDQQAREHPAGEVLIHTGVGPGDAAAGSSCVKAGRFSESSPQELKAGIPSRAGKN